MLLVACLLVRVGGWTEPHNTQNEWKRMDKTRDAWKCETSHTKDPSRSPNPNPKLIFFCVLLPLPFVLLSKSWIPKTPHMARWEDIWLETCQLMLVVLTWFVTFGQGNLQDEIRFIEVKAANWRVSVERVCCQKCGLNLEKLNKPCTILPFYGWGMQNLIDL